MANLDLAAPSAAILPNLYDFHSISQACRPSPKPVAEIVQCGPDCCKALRIKALDHARDGENSKLLILLTLRGWLAALDDFRNWLIREAA